MDVIQWWVGAAIVGAGLLLAAVAWWVARPRRTTRGAVPAANLDRIRALPGFHALARAEWDRRRIEVACLLLALAGTALMGSRLIGVGDDSEEMQTRDVVLCLDVSRSMSEVDADVIDTWVSLAETLDEERIGLVVFDAYAVTGFPLTTDHTYVREQLLAVKATLAEGPVAGTTAPQVGSSLIGDGLSTCLQHFDDPERERSRTVVLGTDNLVSGDSVYTVDEASEQARDADVMVFAITPRGTETRAVDELRAAVRSTTGDLLLVEPGRPANTAVISDAVESQQKSAILAMAQDRSFDRVWPGAVLLVVGLIGSLATAWRRP